MSKSTMAIPSEIKAICKRCKRSAPSEKFVLDTDYRMMVCPYCILEKRDKKMQAGAAQQKQEIVRNKPAGWDSDDDYLEKAAEQKKASSGVIFERIDAEKIKSKCPKCKYGFIYNTAKKFPSSCPYCGTPLPTTKFDNAI